MHIFPADPHEPISIKFGTADPLAYLITHDNFLAIGLGVLNLWGVEFCNFPISRRSPLSQCWSYRAARDVSQHTWGFGIGDKYVPSRWIHLNKIAYFALNTCCSAVK